MEGVTYHWDTLFDDDYVNVWCDEYEIMKGNIYKNSPLIHFGEGTPVKFIIDSEGFTVQNTNMHPIFHWDYMHDENKDFKF